MDIKKIDKNFNIKSDNADGLKIYTLPCEPFDLYGVYYEEETGRVNKPVQRWFELSVTWLKSRGFVLIDG